MDLWGSAVIWRRIAYLWSTPSAFRREWRKYALNQTGHFLCVGVLPGAVLGAAWIPVILAAYFVWELTQWQFRRAAASDCVEDWTFVAAGCAFGATGDVTILSIAAGFLLAGIFWRLEE